MSAGWRALAASMLRDTRVRVLAFAWTFALYSAVEVAAYRHAYPTLADRAGFARSFAGNTAIRLFYGEPHDLLGVGGYTAWRVGGTLAIAAAAFGLLAAVRALRTEEDAGRTELVLAGALGRTGAYVAAMASIACGLVLLWAAELAGLLAAGLPAGPCAFLALASTSVGFVCAAAGALVSQIAPTRRLALDLGGALVGVLFALRVIADTVGGAGWLRWATPLGWAEEMRPFTGERPLVLIAVLAAGLLMGAAAWRISLRRDLGTGLLAERDTAPASLRLLSSPTAQALRAETTGLAVWIAGVAAFAFILGTISASISAVGVSARIQRDISSLGAGSILTPRGYLSFVFIFFVLAISLFCCAQCSAARHEEAEGRVETLLAEPSTRSAWLGGRLLLTAGGALALSLAAGLLAWVGTATQGVSISLARMLEAGVNCMPAALLFLGVAALLFALAPRACAPVAYGLVVLSFLWQLVGSLLGAPHWLVQLTPFAHVALIPAQTLHPGSAVAMACIGAGCAALALAAFRRRDLVGH
jgi:ABC-2 type transport system permease protein